MKRMSSRSRRLVALVLSLSMVLSGTPTPLRAEEAVDESGYVLPVQPRVPDASFEEDDYLADAADAVPVVDGGYQSDVAISPFDDAPNIGPRRELTEDELFAEGELLAMAEATTDEEAEVSEEVEEAVEAEATLAEEEDVELEVAASEDETAELEAATAEEEAAEVAASSTEEVVEDEVLPAEEGPSAEEALPGEDPTTTETSAEAEDAPLFDDAENSETPAPEAPEQDGEPAEAEELPSPDEGAAEPLPSDAEAAAPEGAQPLPEQEEANPEDPTVATPDAPAPTPDDQPLTPQAKSVKDYSYAVTPLLAPFNNLIYVKTDNPDPKSFRLTDKQSAYLDKGAETSFVLYDRALCDVVYEDVATRRVRGGYIFYDYDCKSDGGALAVQALAGDGTFADVGKSVSCPTLKDRYDYLLDTYASSSMSFFEKLNAVQAGLEDISVYPRALRDASKPNTTRPYPYLATSPYREMILNDHVGETYLKNDEGLFLSALHPFVIDSLGFPGTMYNVAKRLGYTGEYKSGSNHAYVGITSGGTTRYYGGAGRGDPGSLYSMHAGAPFTFDGSSSDLATHASINALTARYLDLVSKADDYTADLLDQVQGEAFDQAIGSGSWIRVVRERSQTVWYSYVADGPDGGTNAVSDAWVDGRYVNDWEEIALGEKFEDHPTASIVLHNVSYTDKSGKKRKGDVEYVYNKDKNVWWAPYYYSGAWGYVSPITLPDELILTPAEVKALVPDKNTNALPLSGLVYDGTEPPGTPFGGKAVTGVTLPKSMTVRALEHFEITAQLQPSDALHTTGQWTSSDDNMVRTFPSDRAPVFKAFAQKEGTVTLTFTSDDGGYSASCRVTALPARKSISYATINCARSAMYTGKPVTLDAEVILDDTTLAYGKDYDVTYENNTACGWARIIVVGKGDYKDSTAQYFSIYPAPMKDATVKTIADQAYTGGARKPAPVVTLNGVTLKSGTDYTVAYEDNVNVGMASVILTGKGNYSGTKTATFKIVPASIAKATVAAVSSQTYTGEAHEPAPVVTLGGVALKAGTDYTVTYKDNVNAGTATITINGMGNYAGTKTATFKIGAADIAGATVARIANQTYRGSGLTPVPSLTMGGKTLASGTDYTLSYANNTKVGTATVTITGKGNYAGTKTATFKIVPASIEGSSVASIAKQTYTGKALSPAPKVTFGGATLKAGTDYTVAYGDNVAAGTATVTLTGKGNFAGTKTVTFNIVPASIAKATVAAVPNQTYTGKKHEPAPVVTIGGETLTRGSDYTLAYTDNVNAGTATITINGTGNYAGAKTATFKIGAAGLSGAKVGSIADALYEGKPVTPKPVVTLGGKTLAEGTDYTLSYANNGGPGTGTVTVTGKGNYAGSVKATFAIDRFPDVRRGSWFYVVVNRAAELGLVNGFADGTFGPNERVTRGQVAVMLWNMAGRPKPVGTAKSFPDVKSGAYYYNAVSWASSVGVVNGFGDGTFGPAEDVTREQLATMLASYAKRVGGLEVKGSAADFASMADAGKVSGYARPSVGWCFRNKVISGKSGNLIDPQGTATRAETAKMVVFVRDMLQ